MRALAADSHGALTMALADLAPGWTIGLRTGDTPSVERAKQDRRLPTVLVSTPESLTPRLIRADAAERLAGVRTVVVDEWHERVRNKRGVQVQLHGHRAFELAQRGRQAPHRAVHAPAAAAHRPVAAGPAAAGPAGTLEPTAAGCWHRRPGAQRVAARRSAPEPAG